METTFSIHPIGTVHKQDSRTWIDLNPRYKAGLSGLEAFSHIHVYYWFNENDTSEKRSTLQIHPRKNPENPLTGVFATHAPVRPNLIAHTICKCLAVEGVRIYIDEIDARSGTPVIDIKSYLPDKVNPQDVRMPAWATKKR